MSEGQSNQRTCATCGEAAGPNDRYCRHCGAPLPPSVERPAADESQAEFPTQRFGHMHETSTPPASESVSDDPHSAEETAHTFESTTTSSQFSPGTPPDQQQPPRPTWQAQQFSDLREEKKPNRRMWWIIGIAVAVVVLFCCCMLLSIAAIASTDNALHRELEHAFRIASLSGLLN